MPSRPFPEIVLFVIEGEEEYSQSMPVPFPEIVLFVIEGEEE